MVKDINEAQTVLHERSLKLLTEFESIVCPAPGPCRSDAIPAGLAGNLTAAFLDNADTMVATYTLLFDELLFKYADGFVNVPVIGSTVGYPAWWLRAVGYQNGPGPVPPQ